MTRHYFLLNGRKAMPGMRGSCEEEQMASLSGLWGYQDIHFQKALWTDTAYAEGLSGN